MQRAGGHAYLPFELRGRILPDQRGDKEPVRRTWRASRPARLDSERAESGSTPVPDATVTDVLTSAGITLAPPVGCRPGQVLTPRTSIAP